MKKIILALSVAAVVVSCKKVAEGGNKGVIRKEEGVERYSDDVQGGAESHATNNATENAENTEELVDIELEGLHLKGKKNGFEAKLAKFLSSDAFKTSDENALKSTWYDFDNVNFKMASSNELLAGADQLKNLAEILKKYPEAKIKIGGYTDNVGDKAVNKKLSQDRANFIKSELTKLGVGAQVVAAEGYGSEFATVPATASDAERAVDRKMAVRFTK